EVLLRHEQWLAAENGKGAPLSLDRRLHRLEVIGAWDVVGVAYRVLVAVLALDVARHTSGTQLYRHRTPRPRRSAMNPLISVVPRHPPTPRMGSPDGKQRSRPTQPLRRLLPR